MTREKRAPEPKLHALRALCHGRLSERGAQRLLRHLANCEACRDGLRGIRAHEALRTEVRESAITLDYARAQLALQHEARRLARVRRLRRRLLRAAIAIAMAAVASAAIWFSRS